MAPVELQRPVSDVRRDLHGARTEGLRLLTIGPEAKEAVPAFREAYLAWESRTAAVLETSFKIAGFMTTSPKDEFTGTAISLLDLKISSTSIPLNRVPEVVDDIREKVRVLGSIDDRLDVYQPMVSTSEGSSIDAKGPIFLVHGRDVVRKEEVRRFLERVTDQTVIVLADQANSGRDLLGKLLANAERASFAVVLLTADDYGGLVDGDSSPRARQNVVFELGLFLGLLGRDRVVTLNEPQVELPSDFGGVVYLELGGQSWQIELARELKAAGIAASLDRII